MISPAWNRDNMNMSGLERLMVEEESRIQYEARLRASNDQRALEATAEKRGMERGIRRGMMDVRREGRREGKLSVALMMLDSGLPLDTIVKCTGLSEKEVLNLK
jgi:predicted transposase/invertase (TIGR01784 family)